MAPLLAMALAAAACQASDESQDPNSKDDLGSLSWQEVGTFAVDAYAKTDEIAVSIPASVRFIALRVHAAPLPHAGSVCFQLDKVQDETGRVWVENSRRTRDWGPACRHCSQRVSSGRGYGFFVFPNDGRPLVQPKTLRLRVVLRDCKSGMAADNVTNPDLPQSVRLQLATGPAVAADARGVLQMRVAVTPGSGFSADSLASDPRWQHALTFLRSRLHPGGVDLQIGKVSALPQLIGGTNADSPLRIDGLDEAMDPIFAAALERLADGDQTRRFLPLILTRCVARQTDTSALIAMAGLAPRVPGGAPLAGVAGGVFLTGGACAEGANSPTDDALAYVLAHEIGHYLGLHHSDGVYSSHRQGGSPADLMATTPGPQAPADAAFTAAQLAVVRRHPDVVFSP